MRTYQYLRRGSPAQRCGRLSGICAAILLASCDLDVDNAEPQAADTGQPPPTSALPPLAAAVISLDDGHRVGSNRWADGGTSDGGLGQPVGGLECVYPSPITYHVHAHLSVFLHGEALAVPRLAGIVETSPTTECHYPLHTHDASGLIHVHATAPTQFTLGQFFAIWGQPLARDNVAGLLNLPVVAYITDDDVVSEHTGELAMIELISHREITIQVGGPIAEIPRYGWAGD